MSLHLESPQSDSKMDTSDTTASLGSAGFSPDEQAMLENDKHNIESIDFVQDGDMKSKQPLDNRIVHPKISLQNVTPQRIETQNHPLMAMNNMMDSEKSYSQIQATIDRHNFPDVVPQTFERLQPHLPDNAMNIRNTLNTIRSNNVQETTIAAHNKLKKLRAYSPDLLSSESDAEVSQYHAAVEADFQAVALISNVAQPNNSDTLNKTSSRIRKSGDDVSSLDSISNHSFDDEDLAHNLASLSPSSSLIDGLDDDDDCEGPEDDFLEPGPTPIVCSASPTAVPQYSAAEERRDSRNWQKIVLPDGRMRDIDMRVIEPYKRLLSHGGYLKAGGHNAIVIFCACHLPDRSRADYNYVMDNLFLYVVKTLEQLVTEDYVLIYLHGGSNRRNVPPFPWLKKCYQLIDRRLRKSLKNLYFVHPTFWIKSLVWMGRPFVSAKFWRKLIYVNSLQELSHLVAVEKAAIPEKVKQYDAKYN